MQVQQALRFDSYRVDPQNECVWRGKQAIRLTSKAFAVLQYLVQHPGRIVTKEELFRAVWPETVVGDAALAVCVQELRKALRDPAKASRLIATVHRRGYRFLAEVTETAVQGTEVSKSPSGLSRRLVVGRETEVGQLHRWLEEALQGERQIVFVTGEQGIGKTTVIDTFLAHLATGREQVRVGRGQCIEQYGAGEPYLPVLEALGELCRASDGQQFKTLLGQHAPTWLVQMPSLLSAAEVETLQHRGLGATRERMLLELADALEVITAERALMLILEDIHWSDESTLVWLGFVARRRQRCRLLMVGTYRPAEMLLREHPLRSVKQELQVHGQCAELALGYLSEETVAEYLRLRFGGVPRTLARLLHQRTDGNALFVVNVVEDFIRQGIVQRQAEGWVWSENLEEQIVKIPASLQQFIEQHIEQLAPEEQQVLVAASVAGVVFSAAAVAAGIESAIDAVETRCESLVRQGQFLRACGAAEWPDGTVAARYSFIHTLYQEVLYNRLTERQRLRLHQRIGEREEVGYGSQAGEIAAELAVHFTRGRDYTKAVQYLQQAGENAVRRSTYYEATAHLRKGLELLRNLPNSLTHTRQELSLLLALGVSLNVTKGNGAPEVGRTYARARELCLQTGEPQQLFSVLLGLRRFHVVRGEFQTGRALGEELLSLAQGIKDPGVLVRAHMMVGEDLLCAGAFGQAREHAEQGIALYDTMQHRSHTVLYGNDSGTGCLSYAALALWSLGYPDLALARSQEAHALAQELAHPVNLVMSMNYAAWFHQLRREAQAVQEQADVALVLSIEQGFPLWTAFGSVLKGWALTEQGQDAEGIAQMRQGLVAFEATGTAMWRSYFLALLAEVYGKIGQIEEGLTVLAEALAVVDKTEERREEAELYRLKGELTLKQSSVQRLASSVQNPPSAVGSPQSEAEAESEACFHTAIGIARRQSAKSLELRAVMSLARLWQRQGKNKVARRLLAEIYGWFNEGFNTKDLQEAKTLLEELS